MRYFTKQLWRKFNEGSASMRKADELFKRQNESYKKYIIDVIKPAKRSLYNFYLRNDRYDGRLLSFSTGDAVNCDIHNKRDLRKNRIAVKMEVINGDSDKIYCLQYKKVQRIVFDFPSEEPLFNIAANKVGDWGYDEMHLLKNGSFRHEIVFSSGAVILIEFTDFMYTARRIE